MNKSLAPLVLACISMVVFNVSALVKGILRHDDWRSITGGFGCLCMIVVAILVLRQNIKALKASRSN